jgi:hypothetical protein
MEYNGTDYHEDLNGSYSNSTPTGDDAPFWLDDPCARFDFFYNTVFVGALCLFGMTVNILSIVVLHFDKHNKVATFLLQSLAAADTSVLALSFVVIAGFIGTARIPGVYTKYTRFAIPYLKKVSVLAWYLFT